MRIREPSVAGLFYPSQAKECREAVERLVDSHGSSDRELAKSVGGLVPHAGWPDSGQLAAQVLCVLLESESDPCLILFGGCHRSRGREAALFGSGRWETPLGPLTVDERLAERICGHTNLIIDDPYAHESEHSIEVQTPFIKYFCPQASIVPIMVPPTLRAHEVGKAVARTLKAYGQRAIIIGTTELTHYGLDYGFVPKGEGEVGLKWAKQENDRRFLDLVCSLKSERVVAEACENANACSSGAVAATLAAASELGAGMGVLMGHTTSGEMADRTDGDRSSVGYAGVVFV